MDPQRVVAASPSQALAAKEPSPPPLAYRIARVVIKAALYVFYRRIQVWGREHIPESGPVVFAANHPNASVDPLLIAAFPRRLIHYCARAPIFDRPLVGFFLRQTGAIPLYRQRDDPSLLEKNLESFEHCYQVLGRGEALGIFPEGVSYTERKLHPVKTGTARIVLVAEARHGFSLGVRIVPVGLNFRAGYAFQGNVFIQFGEPINPSPYFSLYATQPHEAVHRLTDVIRQHLEALTVSVRETSEENFLGELAAVYAELEPTGDSLREEFQREKHLLDACRYFDQTAPLKARALRHTIHSYARLVRLVGFHGDVLARSRSRTELGKALAGDVARLLLGLPLAAWGAVNNYLPYLVPRWFARRMTADVLQWARLKMTAGALIFAVFYAVQTYVVAQLWGGRIALLYAASLAPAGFFTLHYGEWLARFATDARAMWLVLRRRHLLRELRHRRNQILAQLDECRQRYLEGRGMIPEEEQTL